MSQWTNDDGLTVWFGEEQAQRTVPSPAHVSTMVGPKRVMVIDFTYDAIPAETSDLDNDGTNDGWNDNDPYIPAGSYITSATLIATTDWATADAADLTIGLETKAGAVIDADGIDAAIAAAALDLGDVVLCDGALVGGTVYTGTADAYVKAIIGTGSFTTGAARLIIEYIVTGDGV